jgi:hypothetical protein
MIGGRREHRPEAITLDASPKRSILSFAGFLFGFVALSFGFKLSSFGRASDITPAINLVQKLISDPPGHF